MFKIGVHENGCDYEVMSHPKDWRYSHSDYGWTYNDAENQIDIRFTTRQDGQVSWGIMHSEPDGEIHTVTGICDFDDFGTELPKALVKMLESFEWLPQYVDPWRAN